MNGDRRSARNQLRAPVTALIIALILALAAPSLAFVAVLLFQSDTIGHRQMEARAEQGVAAISQALDRELRSMVTNLAVFASSGWIETEEYQRLHARAADALRDSDTYLIAVDSKMQQILNTRVPWGTQLPITSDPNAIRNAIYLGQPAVSDVFFGRTAQKNVFNVIMPLISGERRVAALILTRNVETLPTIFKESLPPLGWSYAVFDSKYQLAAGKAPQGATEAFLDLCKPSAAGLRERVANGIQFSAASSVVQPWGWTTCVWTSSQEADSNATQRWRNFTILATIVVVVMVLSGVALGQMLTRAIRRAATVGRVLDAGGDVPEMHSVVREVDEVLGTLTRAARRRLQHDQEQTILMRETAHRAKNQIAIATALARLSARSAGSVEQLRDDIVARLSALGQSIDMMSKSPSGAVDLSDLISTQLDPFTAGHAMRLSANGPRLRVSPTTAQSLGLVLHEMATNAAKYGAWSVPEGRVLIEWATTDDGGLELVWTENGGPPPQPPERTGFGSSLIDMMIERTLGGSVKRDYPPAGIVVVFTLKPDGPLD